MAERKREGPVQHREVRDPQDGDDAAADEDADQEYVEEGDAEYDSGAAGSVETDAEPDVFLDVPSLKVEEIHLEVDDLNAQVSLQANVLDLLKLHVGAEVSLARVLLDIKGVDAAARLTVRLDKVASIIERVMETIDNNPQIVSGLTRGLGEAGPRIASGTAGALDEVGKGTERAAEGVGEGAGSAIESVSGDLQEAADDLGEGASRAVENGTADSADSTDQAGRGRGRALSGRQVRGTDRAPAERPPLSSGERPRRAGRQEPAATRSPRREPEARRNRRSPPE